MKILGIIPARYNSTRFPGKPLAVIQGMTMIQRVYEQAVKAKSLSGVVGATDDQRIFEHVKNFGGNAVMTSPAHANGTERCAEALTLSGKQFDAVINIQGDEPFIYPEQIDLVAGCLLQEGAEIATLVKRMEASEEKNNSSIVKVTVYQGEAMNFSRALLPPTPDVSVQAATYFFKHIGIYGFKADTLKRLVQLISTDREKSESLEQLRWLDNGYKIKVRETVFETQAVDTPGDIEKLLNG